jgi:hypothetical protein
VQNDSKSSEKRPQGKHLALPIRIASVSRAGWANDEAFSVIPA